MNLAELKKPFSELDIEWRIGRCGMKNDEPWAMALAYITARAIHDRLDEVCEPHKWQLRYREHLGETVCEIGIKFDNEWIWKSGGGAHTDFEPFKGGLSSAEKRAGVPWGIGRYLYKLPETFVKCSLIKTNGWKYAKGKKSDKSEYTFYWLIPKLPDWALPANGHKFSKANNDKISIDQITALNDLIKEKKFTIKNVLAWCNDTMRVLYLKLADIDTLNYDKILAEVKARPAK